VRVFLSTADASGDLHAAALLEALRARVDRLEAFGLGGDALVAAGLRPLVHQHELAVAGLVEVLPRVPRIVAGYTALRRALNAVPPDLAIFVDSPDLNLPLASVAKRRGIPVFYCVAPQAWAWRSGRVRKLARRVDRLGVIFRFEEAWFRARGVPATFVGHPLVERMAALRERLVPTQVAAELSLDPARPILGLLPGSRTNEIAANLPLQLEAALLVRRRHPELQIRVLLAPTVGAPPCLLPDGVVAVRGRTHEAMALATVLLAAPGTVTIEAALLGTPLVVAHRVNRLSFEIARRLARVPSSCMVNLVAGAPVVPERLQAQARPTALAALVSRLVSNPAEREKSREALLAAARELGPPGAAARAAEVALEVARGRA
jgi:lipid-A-disaccharide synthase